MNIVIRQAKANDKEFIINSIVEAEKSGSDMISYCAIFSITEHELHDILGNILDEEMDGQEFCISNFLVAEVDGQKAAALSTWIEQGSGMIKSNLLLYFLGGDKITIAAPHLSLLNEINIRREAGALQVECVYTDKKFRGLGLIKQLIEESIKWRLTQGNSFTKAQVILLKNNDSAIRAYEKAGFSIAQEKQCPEKNILKILPGDAKILMERKIISG
jgi:GNAT superfamily N-acetyltransferase